MFDCVAGRLQNSSGKFDQKDIVIDNEDRFPEARRQSSRLALFHNVVWFENPGLFVGFHLDLPIRLAVVFH